MKKNTLKHVLPTWDTEYDTWSAFQAATQWGPTKYVQF